MYNNRLRNDLKINKPIILILFVAFLLRLIAAAYIGNEVSGLSGAWDEISYDMLAHRYVDGYGLTFPQDWYPWIKANTHQSYFSATMSMYLALIYWIFGYKPVVARVVTALLSTISVFLIYILAKRLFSQKVAILSAIIASLYAYLIFYGVTLVTETPFILMILLSIYLAYEISDSPSLLKWLLIGITLSITVLFRMAVVFYVPFLIGWVIWKQRDHWIYGLVPIVMIVLTVTPFTLRNYQIWGRFLLLEAQFGHVFWNGNHPDSEGDFHPYRVFTIPDEVLVSNNDAIITNQLLRMGLENIFEDPGLFVSLTITRLREFFKFWPTSESDSLANIMRVLSFGLLLPLSLIGLWFAKKESEKLLPIWIFMVIHTAVYAVSWTMIRYRIPLDAFLAIFAGLAIAECYYRVKSSQFLLQRFRIRTQQ